MRKFDRMAGRACAVAFAAWVLTPASEAEAQSHSFQQIAQATGTTRAVTTGETETVEVVLADGTSVIVSPGGSVTVEISPDDSVTVNVTAGLVRVAGGPANDTRPIEIVTPHSRMQLRAGAAMIDVSGGATRAHLLFGDGLAVVSGGVERLLYRPGFEVVLSGGAPSRPRRMTREEVVADLMRLSVGLSEETLPRVLGGAGALHGGWGNYTESGGTGTGSSGIVALAFDATQNAAGVDRVGDDDDDGGTGGNGNGGGAGGNGGADADFSFDLAGGLDEFGLSGGSVGEAPEDVDEQNTTRTDGNIILLRQAFDDARIEDSDGITLEDQKYVGPTTNRLFAGESLSVRGGEGIAGHLPDEDPTRGVAYYFGTLTFGLGLTGDPETQDGGIIRLRYPDMWGAPNPDDPTDPYHLDAPDGAFSTISESSTGDPTQSGRVWMSYQTTFGPQIEGNLPTAASDDYAEFVDGNGPFLEGKGVQVSGLAFGLEKEHPNFQDDDDPDPSVRADHFLFMDMKILTAIHWLEGACVSDCTQGYVGTVLHPDEEDLGDYTVHRAFIDEPDSSGRFVFATGALDEAIGAPAPGHSVDRFHLSAGMEGDVLGGIEDLEPGMDTAGGSRAFQRAETWTTLAGELNGFDLAIDESWGQSDFMVVNPKGAVLGDDAITPKLLYADVGFAEDAQGRQVSTISAAIGELQFRQTNEIGGADDEIVDGILRFRSVGSSRGLDAQGRTRSSLLVTSDFESTAAGGGNPNLPEDRGRLGFFVVENAGRIFDDVAADSEQAEKFRRDAELDGGRERAVGATGATRFAALRLGVARGTEAVSAGRWGAGAVRLGYAAAILEREEGDKVTLGTLGHVGDDQFLSSNLTFDDFDDAENTFRARLGNDLVLGGPGGLSAYVDDDAYGARSDPAEDVDVALIAGQMVAHGIENEQSIPAGQTPLSESTKHYEHVKWGFFFGDADSSGERTHAHMGSFAAGPGLGDLQQLDGIYERGDPVKVTYTGHLVGNVLEGGGRSIRTATGNFSDTFDFGSRKGVLDVRYDGRRLTGDSSAAKFHRYRGKLSGGGLEGRLNGRFVGPLVEREGVTARTPAGVVGAFSMTDGRTGGYRSVGTFAGE